MSGRTGGNRNTVNESSVSENELSETVERTPLKRREVLTTVGALAVIPAVASREVSATDHGYGVGAYGDGPYGDPVEDGAGEETILTVETHGATGVDGSSATLTGELTQLQGYDAATVYFEWGQIGDLTKTTDAQTLASTGGFDDEVTDLEGGTEYAFRAVAESDGDSDAGDTLTLTTESAVEAPDAVPQIVRLSARDTSNPRNPHADATVVWEASIEEGELDSAELRISDSTGEVHSWNYDLCGQSVERSASTRIHHGGEEAYTVELTVHSNQSTTESEQTTFDAP